MILYEIRGVRQRGVRQRSVCQVRIGKSEPSAGFGNPAGARMGEWVGAEWGQEREWAAGMGNVRMPGSDWQIRTICRIWQSGRSGKLKD